MDTFHGPCFHFCLEPALETWVKALLTHPLWVHNVSHTHSLSNVQWSGPSDHRTLLRTKSCLKSHKWSHYKVKGAFSTPICARKQTNSPPGTDQGFFIASCNSRHALSARAVDPLPPFLLVQNLPSKWIVPTDNMQSKTDNAKKCHLLSRVE